MANHKSAWKRIRQNEKSRERNVHYKTLMKNKIRKVRESLTAETDKDSIQKVLSSAISAICKIASKGIIHKRTASRKVSRISKAVNKFLSAS